MGRPFVSSTFALALALGPAVLFAQAPAQPPAGQPPAQPPGQAAAPSPAPPAAPKLTIASPAGALLVPIKPDQTAVFEEFATKLKAGLAASSDPLLMQPAVPNAEYELFAMLRKTMTDEQLRAPETQEMWKRYTNAFAAGPNRLSL